MSRNRYDYSRKSYRNTGLLSHYHECASRVFANGRRPNEYLHNLFLSAAKNGEYERVENFLSRTTTSPINVDFKDKKTGNTAMILAASQNHGKVVSLLLNYGADITLSNDAGQSVLDMAPRSLIPLLIDSVERQGTSSRHLLQAAWQGNVQILKRLLSSPKKVDVNCTNADGMTPLLLVTRDINMFEQVEQRLDSAYNPIEVVQELLLHKADCSISGKEGRHALHQIATTRGPNAEKIASLLIKEGGCNPDILDGHRYSPIHLASKENNVPIVLALVDGGGDVNVRGCGGKTPLHIAASNGHQSVSGVLVENGADVTLVDDHGYSAMDVTSSQSVRRILREAWVGQTLKNKPRAHSAMPGLFQKPEDQLQLTKKGDHQENVESTEKFDPEDVIVNRSSSQSSNRTESRVPPLVTPEAKLLSPSPPKTGNRRSNRNKGTSLIGTIPESYGQVTQPRRTELPYLAVKNIELHIGRNPRSPLTVGSKCSRGTYIQRYRFYKSHSAPVPPETRRKRSLPGTPNTPLGPHGRSVRPPTRVAPLLTRRISSPDLRVPVSQCGLRDNSGLTCVGQILDLDALRAGSSCSRSLAKIFYPESQDDSQPPPPPPCDLQSEYLVDTRLYTTVDSRSNPIPESDLHTTLEDQTLISDSPSRTIQHQNELNNVDPTVNNRHDTMSNTFAHISSHDNKGDAPAADLQDSAFITFEISTHTLLHKEEQHHKKQNDIESNDLQEKQGTDNLETSAVSLSTQLPDSSTTTSKEVESSHKDDDERRTINVPSGDVIIKSLEKNSSANFVLVETQTFSAEKSPTFWIPYKGDEAPSVDSSTNTQNDSDSKRSRTSSSMTFFVHLNDNEDQDHVQVNKTFSKCRLCGEAITESTSSQCDRCSKKVADEKAFWVSLETQTKQEIGGDGSTELNETNRAETASLSIETIGIIRSSTFVKEENSEESTKTPEGCDSAPSGAVDKSIEPEYENKSAPKDTVDLLTQPAKGKQNSSKSTVAHNTEMVLRSFGLDNEYAIEQESEVQQGAVFENQEAPEESSTCISDPSKLREPPKSAWSTPRQEKSPSGLQICNPFPSPVPPINTIPPVQPPIGVQCSRPVTSAKKKGRGKSRTSTAKKRTNSGKECSRGSGSGGKNIKEQATKGKKKGKKKSKCKEIEVNQSAAGVACYGGGFIASAAYGCVEYALSPDLDSMPTLSLDPRAFSGRPARAAIVNLSPIPEVPTPSPSPNESLKSTCSRKGSLDGFSSTPVRTSTDGLEKEAAELDELITFLDDAEKEVDEENASKTSPSAVSVEKQSDANEGDFDVVDGGFISRFAGMCIPRLILLSRNSDSDDEDLLGKDELLAASPNTSPSEIPVSNICTKGESNDNGESVKAFVGSNVLPDEADDDIEGIVHNLIRDTEKTTQLNVTSPYSDAASTHGSDTTQELTSGNQFDTSTKDVVEKDSDDQPGDRLSKDWDILRQMRTMEYLNEVNQMRRGSLEVPNVNNSDRDHTLTNVSSLSPGQGATLEVFSDNDSSYNSLESTPRTTSDCSSHGSSDSFFSSPRAVSSSFKTDSYDFEEDSSMGIPFAQDMHRKRISAENSSGSNSNDSSSTLRALSSDRRNSSGWSSEFLTPGRALRSRQSRATTISQTSTVSRGEEIEWQKGNVLGKGAFGTVFLGLVNTGELIAVKQVELHPNNVDAAERQYEKLQEEVGLLKSLKHKNIVQYIGTCMDDSQCTINIFMEFVPGGSIAQALKRFGAFVEPVFRRYTRQILDGVSYLHNNNVIHRDIKGGNIMLMPNGVIKLIDFGCAKKICMNISVSKSNILRSMRGTPYWMAPEVIRETGHGRKSDIWSIGCTVFEMATGQPPWSNVPPLSAIFAIGNGSPVPRLDESFSAAAIDFVTSCMTRDQDTRPSADELLRHDFLQEPH